MNNNPHRSAAVYTRVSTDDQTTTHQTRAIEQYAINNGIRIVRKFNETHSAYGDNSTQRPLFKRMLEESAQGKFDVIIVWSIDRLSRSLPHLLSVMTELHNNGVHPIFIKENINTTTPEGKLFLAMFGAFAEFSSSMTSARTKLAYENAISNGKSWGRKTKYSKKKIEKIVSLRKDGLGYYAIGKQLNIPTSSVKNILKRLESTMVANE